MRRHKPHGSGRGRRCRGGAARPLDALVNSAGVVGPVGDYSVEEWQRVLDVNLNGTFFAMHHALAQMALQGSGGSVVNLSSIAGLRGLRNTAPSRSPYAA